MLVLLSVLVPRRRVLVSDFFVILHHFLRGFFLILTVVVLQVRGLMFRLVNLEVIPGAAADQHHSRHKEDGTKIAVWSFCLGFRFGLRGFLRGLCGLWLRFRLGSRFRRFFFAFLCQREQVRLGHGV